MKLNVGENSRKGKLVSSVGMCTATGCGKRDGGVTQTQLERHGYRIPVHGGLAKEMKSESD